MIKTISNYYVNTPFVSPESGLTCTEYTLDIFVWNGNKFLPPSNPTYSKTIENASGSNGNSPVSISRLINDFIDFNPGSSNVTALIDGNNQLWVKTKVFYTTSDPGDLAIGQNVTIDLALRGYGYGIEGENPSTPADKVLIQGREFNVSRKGVFNIPIEIDETPEVTDEINFTVIQIVESLPTQTEANLSYNIASKTPTTVTVQTSEKGANVWTDFETYANSSPLMSVVIPYLEGGSTDLRIVFYFGGEFFVSTVGNIFEQ